MDLSLPIKSMTNSMKARGPDDEGFLFHKYGSSFELAYSEDTISSLRNTSKLGSHIDNYRDYNANVVLGHRRLPIIDLSENAHQPFFCEDQRYAIVYNGEIYNYIEIRNELIGLGYIFNSSSDTEVILKAYIEWGTSFLNRLNGDFAFAIYDTKLRILFCARDRFGVKPLFFSKDNDFFIFGSDLTAILSSGIKRAEIDQNGLFLNMVYGICPRPLTAFKGIYALRPGSFILIDRQGNITEEIYWKIPVGTELPNMKLGEAMEILEYHLTRSVKMRLVSDATVGTLLSGGIDSTLISAIASINHPGIQAFTMSYGDRDRVYDETEQAKATAGMYELRHIVTLIEDTDELRDIESWTGGHEEPYYSLSAMNTVARQVGRTDTRVVLSGIGADELFAGYSWYKYASVPTFPFSSQNLTSYLDQVLSWIDDGRVSKKAQFLLSSQAARRHCLLYATRSGNAAKKFFNSSLFHPSVADPYDYVVDEYCYKKNFSSSIDEFTYMDLSNYLGNHHMDRGDKFSMRHSIEARFPFLDHELVEACLTIPNGLKFRKNKQKYILKKVAAKYIHKSSIEMKKKGFSLPINAWARGPLKDLIYEKLRNLAKRELINTKYVKKISNEYLNDKEQIKNIWHLFSLEIWLAKYISNS